MGKPSTLVWLLCLCLFGCSDEAADKPFETDAGKRGADAEADTSAEAVSGSPVYRNDVKPVTDVKAALPGTFIPPFDDCRDPVAGEPAGKGPNGQVCTHTMISACTEPGRYYPDYASCSVVRTQRPFWEVPPANEPREDDPRLADPAFMKELDWMTEQVAACACTCCHDSRAEDGKVGQWDINRGPIWLDTLSDTGLALFVGLADSSALGAYPEADNFGFDRTRTGVPTTDTARMQKFLRAEMERRGITEDEARAVAPFGGPIYQNRLMKPVECAGQGVDPEARVQLGDERVRYLYVMQADAENPGVPPDQDLPDGTLWRIDVLASAEPIKGPIAYGSTPKGSFQVLPADKSAPLLEQGKRYKLYALRDVGLPAVNCTFTFGETLPEPGKTEPRQPQKPNEMSGDCDAQAASEAFGASCTSDGDCKCAANYCALMPGQTTGYCTAKGCKDDPSVCPEAWSCFDLSAFSSDLPAICMKP